MGKADGVNTGQHLIIIFAFLYFQNRLLSLCVLLYVGIVSRIEVVIENLKSLPPFKLEMAADYIQRLTLASKDQRDMILARTSGSLSPEVAANVEKEIEEGCEKIDERGW